MPVTINKHGRPVPVIVISPFATQLTATTIAVEASALVKPLDVVKVWTPVVKMPPPSVADTVKTVGLTTENT
jgi:hypothetical protein